MSRSPVSHTIHPARRIKGEIEVPGDKSISHRVAMLSALAAGESEVHHFLRSEDCLNTVRAMGSLGAHVHFHGRMLSIHGNHSRLMQPVGQLDLGNSGTSIRLLSGLVSGHPIEVEMVGDASLMSRPMKRIQEPLQRMGATVDLLGADGRPPVRVKGGVLKGITYEMPVASAQVKSCVLLAGLFAEGQTTVFEKMATRDHTERLLRAMGVGVQSAGLAITVEGFGPKGPVLAGRTWTIPGDFSSAAFWLVAAAAREGSLLKVRGVGLNPRRTAMLDVLERMGAQINVRPAHGSDLWEPYGEIQVTGGGLKGTEIGGEEIPNVIDELPILAVAGALAEGRTVIRDAAELRVKESDRIATMASNLRLMGVEVEEKPDGMVIEGPAKLTASQALRSYGDHRIAMAMAVLSLFADKPSTVQNVACVQTSYPTFWDDLNKLSAGGKRS